MASRIVVFPVLGRRWAFTAVPPTGGPQNGPGSTPQGLSLTELFATLRASPRPSDQAEILTSYASDKMHAQFIAWEAAPEGSIRNRLHRIGHGMLSRLGPTESFLKAIPKDAGLVEIVYPNCVNPRLVRRRVRHLAISGETIHRRYMYGSVALLPFSAILGLLPLPNVVMAWNLFRAYSHWRALQGSRRLNYLVTDSPTEVSPPEPQNDAEHERANLTSETQVSEEKGKGDPSAHWVFLPSENLDSLLKLANVPREAITDVTVAEICKEYPLDAAEIVKWRDQRLPIKSFG